MSSPGLLHTSTRVRLAGSCGAQESESPSVIAISNVRATGQLDTAVGRGRDGGGLIETAAADEATATTAEEAAKAVY